MPRILQVKVAYAGSVPALLAARLVQALEQQREQWRKELDLEHQSPNLVDPRCGQEADAQVSAAPVSASPESAAEKSLHLRAPDSRWTTWTRARTPQHSATERATERH